MSEIKWDAEIRKAKMFTTNAYCMKYIDLADQINMDLNLERQKLQVAVEALKSIADDSIGTWVNGKEQTIIEVCEEALKKIEEMGIES